MKIVEKDNRVREIELAEKELKLKEEKDRIDYLKALKEDRAFNQYVIEGIIKKGISELTDIRKFPETSLNNMEELGKLVIQAKMAQKKLEGMLSDILN